MEKRRGRGTTKRIRNAALIAAAAVDKDGRVTVQELSSANGVSNDTIHKILHQELAYPRSQPIGCPSFFARRRRRRGWSWARVHHRCPLPLDVIYWHNCENRSLPCRLFLVPKSEGDAGWQHHRRRQRKQRLKWGNKNHRQRSLRRRLSAPV